MDSKNQIQKREIKFRAWDGKKMYLPEYTDREDFHIEADGTIVFTREYGFERRELTNRRDDNWILMQFTGLLDKNGKEIYEGDIIEMTDPYGENKAQTEIKYNNGAFTVEADGWFGMGECDVTSVGWAQEEDVSMEVIGNIYENPELL